MKRGWQAAVAVLLAVFAFFAYESLRLSLRDALGPGPGFFPFWLSVAGAALGVFLLFQLHRRPGGGERGARGAGVPHRHAHAPSLSAHRSRRAQLARDRAVLARRQLRRV